MERRGKSSLYLWDKGAWVPSSLSAPAPSLLRHSSYAVMLGQEPRLRSTFPRAGGARKGSPITIKHHWPWAALDGSHDSRNCWGAGLSITLFPQAPVLSGPSGSCSPPELGEGHRWPSHSHPPHSSLPSIFGSGECLVLLLRSLCSRNLYL